MICGMLCHLQTIDDIHEWSQAEPTGRFFYEQFGITKIPCRAQFYNIIGCVDSEKFICAFTKWMQKVVQGDVAGKTVAIDGKTICSTNKLSTDGNALHIASAIISEYGLIIGTRECATKTGEIPVEHVNCRLKRLHILAERYRNRRKRFALRLALVCGLHNYELANR